MNSIPTKASRALVKYEELIDESGSEEIIVTQMGIAKAIIPNQILFCCLNLSSCSFINKPNYLTSDLTVELTGAR